MCVSQKLDLFVIGGGSGGLACAQRAADHGASVMLAEPARLGGTCVNVGCVPKKVMWNAAALAHGIGRAADYGFDVSLRGHDWLTLKQRRDAYVARLNGIYASNLQKRAVRWVKAQATLLGGGRVGAGDEVFEARQIVIATGGHPRIPALPGASRGISSDGFFELAALPRRVAVVGSGYIAVELAGMLAALGAEVTLVIRYDQVLRSFDAMLSTRLMASLCEDGIAVVDHAVLAAVEADGAQHQLRLEDARLLGPFDEVIWAIGRDANSTGLGLEAAGVACDADGFITTDLLQQTSAAGISAIGDVTGRAALTPVAIAAGRRLADRLFGGQSQRHLDYKWIPTVVFSHPPIGTVGLTEREARAEHGDAVQVFESDFVPLVYALSTKKRRSGMKLITVGSEQMIVGLHVIGAGADEMLQGFAVALRMGATKRDFDDTVAIHPTSAEEFVTLR